MGRVKALDHKGASGIFISCTNLPTMTFIEKREKELRNPVVSSNTATLWSMPRLSVSDALVQGIGSLISKSVK